MTASELNDLIVKRLMKRAGGTQRMWRAAVGSVTVYDRATHPHCNWAVTPSGSAEAIAEVERLLDMLRLEFPLIAGDRR